MRTQSMNVSAVTKLGLTLAILLSSSFLSLPAHAGTRDTGGGTGMMVDGKLIVLDLVEAGLETEAAIPDVTPDSDILATLQQNLRMPEEYKAQVLLPLAKKLTDIAQGSAQTAAMMLARAYGFYKFQPVAYKLTAVDDVDSAIGEQRLQIAVRKGPVIYLSKQNWAQLDETNKVALLLHEIIYAFQPLPVGCSTSYGAFGRDYTSCGSSAVDTLLNTSAKTRFFTAFLFRKDWRQTWKKELAPEMKVGNDPGTYSTLFPIMLEDSDGKSQIARFKKGEEIWNQGELTPVFRAIQVWGLYKTKLLLTKKTTVNELYNFCARTELRPTENRDSLLNIRIEMMRRQKCASISMEKIEMKFDLDVITTGTRSANHISVESIPEPASSARRL